MITISETRNLSDVWPIITAREVFFRTIDDNLMAKSVEELKEIVSGILENPLNHTVLVTVESLPVGCFVGIAKGGGEIEIHTFMRAECRGAQAIEAGKSTMKYLFALPDVSKLTSYCPACLPESYWFARRCGWHNAGIAPWKWLKGGIEHLVTLVAISKEEFSK